MATKRGTAHNGTRAAGESRDALLAAGKRLFAHRCYDAVSIKDLGEAAGLNPALVSYYFGGKEGLYRECLAAVGTAGRASMERNLRPPTSREDFLTRFEIFAEEFVLRHLEEREACIILRRDLQDDVVQEVYREHLLPLVGRLQDFLRAARKAGYLEAETDPELAAFLVITALFELVTTGALRVATGRRNFLATATAARRTIRQTVRCLLYGFARREPPAPASTE